MTYIPLYLTKPRVFHLTTARFLGPFCRCFVCVHRSFSGELFILYRAEGGPGEDPFLFLVDAVGGVEKTVGS